MGPSKYSIFKIWIWTPPLFWAESTKHLWLIYICDFLRIIPWRTSFLCFISASFDYFYETKSKWIQNKTKISWEKWSQGKKAKWVVMTFGCWNLKWSSLNMNTLILTPFSVEYESKGKLGRVVLIFKELL